MRKRTKLHRCQPKGWSISPGVSDMKAKHIHWTPSCAMPSRPAMQWNVSSSLQQATSWRDCGRRSMLAKPEVADVVPSRTKYGEMPSEVPREMIR